LGNVRINYIVGKSQVEAAESSLKDLNRVEGITEKSTKDLSNKFREANTDAGKMKRGVNDASGELSKFNRIAKAGAGIMAGFFAVQTLTEFIKDVGRVTGEFQKFQAVLTNTLGSESKAKKALDDIQKFASVTPFSVQQLTASFVKLANQGFIPTTNELRKLGDLSSSVGKDFDQLTEALIDAQVGEFERLKEFGIRASKAGDQVKFTFKGVETQAEFTNEAIRDYILSLGDLQGVSGSMAAISETLQGRISNLGDTYDQFLLRVGQSTSGVAFEAIGFLNELILGVTTLQTRLELFKLAINPFQDLSDASQQALDDILRLGETDTGKNVSDLIKRFDEISDTAFFNDIGKFKKEFIDLFVKEGESASDSAVLFKRYLDARIEGKKTITDSISESIKKQEDESKASQKAFEEQKKRYLESMSLLRHLGQIRSKEVEEFEEISKETIDKINKLSEALFGAQNDSLKKSEERLAESVRMAVEGEAKITKSKREEAERRAEIDEEEQNRRRDAIQASIDLGLSAADSLVGIANNRSQREINELEQQKEYELSLEGRTAEQKAAIQRRFDEQILELRREQARKEKALALFNIAVQTAENAIRLFALTVPPGILSAVAIAAGGLQAGVVASAPLPFNKGTKRVPGVGNTDTVPAILTPGEGVMPVNRMNAYRPAFESMFDGKIKPEVLNSFVKNGGSQVIVNNDMSKVAQAIKGQPKTFIKMDRNGWEMNMHTTSQKITKKINRYT
jgi:uncharacterized protein (DUF697 family)